MTLTFPDPCLYKSVFSCGNYEKDPGVRESGEEGSLPDSLSGRAKRQGEAETMGIWFDTADYYGRRPGMKHLAENLRQMEQAGKQKTERKTGNRKRKSRKAKSRRRSVSGTSGSSRQDRLTLERHGEDDRAIHMISIIGEIEGHDNLSSSSKTTKYEHILPQLAAIEDSSRIEGLLILPQYHGRRCGGGTCHCGDDRLSEQAHRIPGSGRRSIPSVCRSLSVRIIPSLFRREPW